MVHSAKYYKDADRRANKFYLGSLGFTEGVTFELNLEGWKGTFRERRKLSFSPLQGRHGAGAPKMSMTPTLPPSGLSDICLKWI